MRGRAILGILILVASAGLLLSCQKSSPADETVTTTSTASAARTMPATQGASPSVAGSNATTTPAPAGTPAAPTNVVSPDAVWFPPEEAIRRLVSCPDRLCTYRYMQENSASPAATRFFLQHNAFLYKLWDLGKVNLALVRWPFWASVPGYKWLLVNGTPEIDPASYLPLQLDEPVVNVWGSPAGTDDVMSAYRIIAGRPEFRGSGAQWYDGIVEAVTTDSNGAQSFIFQYF